MVLRRLRRCSVPNWHCSFHGEAWRMSAADFKWDPNGFRLCPATFGIGFDKLLSVVSRLGAIKWRARR